MPIAQSNGCPIHYEVEGAQDDVARPRRRLERELAVAADERVLEPRRVGHEPDRKARATRPVACGGYKLSSQL